MLNPVAMSIITNTFTDPRERARDRRLGLAALLLTTLFVPESRAARARRIDPAGQLLAVMMLLLAPFSGRLVAARGPRPPLLAAGVAMTLGGGLSAVGGTGSPGSPDALLLASFVGAARTAWWIITGCGAAVLVLGAATTGAWARGTAERAAALIGTEGTAARPGGSTGARTG
jgi:hypothetical protein